MDYSLFGKVTTLNINGKRSGININAKPEYQDDVKILLGKFNEFTELICPENLKTIDISNRWQNSGNYKPYFWNQYEPTLLEGISKDGYSIWLGIGIDGLKIQCGTTQNYNANRQTENENIFKFINESVKEIMNQNGIYDVNVFSNFKKNDSLDFSFDEHAALFYQYMSNSEQEDIKYFKILLGFLSNKLIKYLESKKTSSKNYENDFKEFWYSDKILQANGNIYATGTKNSYFRQLQKLYDVIDKNIFEIDNIDKLETILNRLENGDLKDYNRRHQNTDPSNGLKQYIIFIKSLQNESTIIIQKPIKVNKIMNIKNIILYGAPGVGKTHNYRKLISLIEEGKLQKEIFSAIQANELSIDNDVTFSDIEFESRIEFITFHQSFGYEDFIEGFRPNEEGKIKLEDGIFKSICQKTQENPDKNFYLIIDEINRGNISKIFGELITLIEESKRDSHQVTLPYSKDKFSVPSNLYIIGTMNTTDKSIALIDIALRRRFTFIKMQPNSDLVLPSFKTIFENLNKQIKDDLGEEYQIGHSYFMNIDESDLDFVKEYKIKPLLEEYYYGDEKINEVLKIIGVGVNNGN